MIIVVGGIKGGTGKTTIATNLTVLRAATGKKVLLVDADEQKSSSIWANQREAMGIETTWTTIPLSGQSVFSQLKKMKDDYNDIIIDVGGRETRSLRASIALADIFLIPFKPRSLDIWTLGDVKLIITEMKEANLNLQCFAIINQADSNGKENEETIQILKQCEEINCIETTIGLRKVFANAATYGLGISEMKIIDKKALDEMQSLYDILYKQCTVNV